VFEDICRNNSVQSTINSIVIIDVSSISAVTSFLYDLGKTENEIKLKWKNILIIRNF